jgi:diguanylate cyclase
MTKGTDQLTGLLDRTALRRDVEAAINAGEGAALALVDLDHFLELNEELGMEAGDRTLRLLGEILNEMEPGRAYRVSGDEFALLYPGLSLEEAFLRAEALRRAIEEAAPRFDLPERHTVTVKVGVAQCPRDAKTEPALMQAADAALAAAAEAGRNRVALPPNEEMVMKSCYYSTTSLRKLKALAERAKRKESVLLREALDDLLRRYDVPPSG